ncbi:nuclear transport factor 2 family protein [Planotetraspora sp. A-T 1434]|uniref:nuclear transport factor 2 family protein n=1 Tax=Planotetraspora sp. A-T 1434 TaxID=2979219 RepID=UPI0021C0EFBE|nr:nuclear transport factor 2 family protein [Planotetraspora sp. A-T 1434]MCT9930006.1 nuclear transport factor 2 family protein [Planotetraspora sp. A-T 1434]
MELIKKYIETWNVTDAAERRRLIGEVWAEDGAYTDPLADVAGRDQIDAVIAAVQEQFPGLVFTLGGEVDAHHDIARFSWHLGPEGAEPLVVGFDVAVLENGRVKRVLGFLDRVPA